MTAMYELLSKHALLSMDEDLEDFRVRALSSIRCRAFLLGHEEYLVAISDHAEMVSRVFDALLRDELGVWSGMRTHEDLALAGASLVNRFLFYTGEQRLIPRVRRTVAHLRGPTLAP